MTQGQINTSQVQHSAVNFHYYYVWVIANGRSPLPVWLILNGRAITQIAYILLFVLVSLNTLLKY